MHTALEFARTQTKRAMGENQELQRPRNPAARDDQTGGPEAYMRMGVKGDEMMMMGSPLSWQLLGVGDCGEPPNNCSPRSPTVIILSASCLISTLPTHPLIFFLLLLHPLLSLSLSSPSCDLGCCF